MTDEQRARAITRGRRLAIAGAIGGALLFVYTVYSEGPAEVLAGIRRVGPGFVFILLLSAVRMAVRSKAWWLCVEDNEHFGLRDAFVAFVTGDAVGNITPLGPVASESTKALLVSRNLPPAAAVSSVVLENICYSISAAAMVAVGTLAFVLGFHPVHGALTVAIAITSAAIVTIVAVLWLLSSQPRMLSRFLRHEGVRSAEDHIFNFVSTRRDRLVRILIFEFSFHAASVLESYVVLSLLTAPAPNTPLLALILSTVERIITIAFKFVPLRLGVDQAGSGIATNILGIGSEIGVTLATIRTARNLFWAAVGLTFLFRRGLSMRSVVTKDAENS